MSVNREMTIRIGKTQPSTSDESIPPQPVCTQKDAPSAEKMKTEKENCNPETCKLSALMGLSKSSGEKDNKFPKKSVKSVSDITETSADMSKQNTLNTAEEGENNEVQEDKKIENNLDNQNTTNLNIEGANHLTTTEEDPSTLLELEEPIMEKEIDSHNVGQKSDQNDEQMELTQNQTSKKKDDTAEEQEKTEKNKQFGRLRIFFFKR